MFGGAVHGPIEDITPTFLTPNVLATLREVDDIAHASLLKHSESPIHLCRLCHVKPHDSFPSTLPGFEDAVRCISQMPVVLIPVHFDRDTQQRPMLPSCQRSVVIRTFLTSDFMTGVPAIPGKDLPIHVRKL